jgi:tetratricopeptide (TPR) repeat protein
MSPGESWQHPCVTENPDHPPMPRDGDAGWELADPDDRESAYGLLQRGQALLKSRHYAQAAVVLERARQLEPGKGSILEALGRACYNSGQHERSREAFTGLLEVDPSAHYGHYALGQSLKQLGFEREARTHLRLAVALAPTSALYRGALARLPDTGPAEPAEAAEPAGTGSSADPAKAADPADPADPSGRAREDA